MKKSVVWLLALFLAGGAFVSWFSNGPVLAQSANDDLPDGAFVARVYYDEIADIEALARYDVWEYNNLAERYVLVSMDRAIYQELTRVGWRLSVDNETTAMLAPAASPDLFNGGYRTVDELYADLAAINATYPTLTELVDYGDSYCKSVGGCTTLGGDNQPGYDLQAMRITNQAIPGAKPAFFLVANIHAREITTPEIAMRLLDWLVEGYGVDADVTWIVDHQEVWIVPTVNPDGHWLVELGTQSPYNGNPFYQRKNANRSNGCNTWPPNSFLQYGVDLNRNHSFMWNTGGSSGFACDQTYRGSGSASEPEVAQLQNLVMSVIPDQRGPNPTDKAPNNAAGILITLHSYSELVLWPWGNTTSPAPNYQVLKGIGDKLASYNGYTSCQPSVCLYSTSGTTDDWSYGELGIPSYTFEVGTQFMPPYSEVDAIQWPDNGPALQYAAKIARTPYLLVRGPDALNVTTTDNGNGIITLTATINDLQNGGQNILRGGFFIDDPYWISGAGGVILMSASDGSYDSPVETVTAVIDTASLSSGQHTIFVHGLDNQRNYGPATAVFIDVP